MKITPVSGIFNSDLPRQISTKIKISILFGNAFSYLGIAFLIMGTIGVIVFGRYANFNFANPLDDHPTSVNGIVTSVERTGISEGKRNSRPVLKYNFYFETPDLKKHNGISYSTTRDVIRENDTLNIEYLREDPSFSRIKNMRMAPIEGPSMLIIFIFPLVGIIFIAADLALRKSSCAPSTKF